MDEMERLRNILYDLPFAAGTGSVETNLTDLAQAALHYYRYGVTHPEEASRLPIGVTDNDPRSNQNDVAAVAGYLTLEQRFGRVDAGVSADRAAALLLGALVSHTLEFENNPTAAAPDDQFVSAMVGIFLGGIS